MDNKYISILSTRPLDDALVEMAAHQQVRIDQQTFIDIQPAVNDATQAQINALAATKATVVFTSMNAVEVLVDALPDKASMPDWTIYCMGGATFTLIKKYWPYEAVVGTARNATELSALITQNGVEAVHFFCGNKRREELPAILVQQNVSVHELTIYETIELSASIDKDYDGVLFFSPSAVNSFFQQNKVPQHTVLFAIGETSGRAIRQFSDNQLVIGDFPSKDQLVHKAVAFFTSGT